MSKNETVCFVAAMVAAAVIFCAAFYYLKTVNEIKMQFCVEAMKAAGPDLDGKIECSFE